MPVRGTISTKGFDKYLARLAEAALDVDEYADRAVAAGGDVLLDGMIRRVPKDTHHLEQTLKRTDPEADGNFHFVEVGLDRDADAETARYGTAQEYGTSSMDPQPYIRPTLDEDAGEARKAMRQALTPVLGEE